jgi:hypothetical protein
MQDPALGAFCIPDAPPGLEFGDDLDREPGALKDPGGAVVLGGTFTKIDPVGFQADVTRHRQPGGLSKIRLSERRAGQNSREPGCDMELTDRAQMPCSGLGRVAERGSIEFDPASAREADQGRREAAP